VLNAVFNQNISLGANGAALEKRGVSGRAGGKRWLGAAFPIILASAKKKNYFIVARIWSHAGRMANDETTPNSTLASI
jgi:hypothetical protein